MKHWVVMFLLTLGLLAVQPLLVPTEAAAELKLPSYASGSNIKSEVEQKGKNITDVALIVVGIVAILGILIGAGYMGSGQSEKGKQVMLGGVVSIVIASLVFGIAKLVAG